MQTEESRQKPLISIILPVYNTEEYLPACLDSILGGTYQNLEIILANDGSTDNSLSICHQYAERDPRIQVLSHENHGVSYTRNRALSVARGEYIGFVDSDDLVEPEMYATLLENIEKSDADIAVCNFYFVSAAGARPSTDEGAESVYSCEDAAKIMLSGHPFTGHLWSKLFRREVLDGVRFDESVKIAEDTLFIWQSLPYVKQVHFTGKPLYRYLMRGDSAYHRPFTPALYTQQKAYEAIIADAEQRVPSVLPYAQYASIISNMEMAAACIFHPDKERNKNLRMLQANLRRVLNKESLSLCRSSRMRMFIRFFASSIHLYSFSEKSLRLLKRMLGKG